MLKITFFKNEKRKEVHTLISMQPYSQILDSGTSKAFYSERTQGFVVTCTGAVVS